MIKDHQNDNGKLPSKQNIINFAKANSQLESFKASKGWFDKFVKRYGFRLKQFRVNKHRKEEEDKKIKKEKIKEEMI